MWRGSFPVDISVKKPYREECRLISLSRQIYSGILVCYVL